MNALYQAALILVLLLVPSYACARDGLWISNKLMIGYGDVYTAVQIELFQLEPPRTRVELGYIFEISDNLNIVPRYQLQLPIGPRPIDHTLGLDLKLRFP